MANLIQSENLIRYYNSSTNVYLNNVHEYSADIVPEGLYFTVVGKGETDAANPDALSNEGVLYVNGINYSSAVRGVTVYPVSEAEAAKSKNKTLEIITVDQQGRLCKRTFAYLDIDKEEFERSLAKIAEDSSAALADVKDLLDELRAQRDEDVSILANAIDEQAKFNASTYVHKVEVDENFADASVTANPSYGEGGPVNVINVNNSVNGLENPENTNPRLSVVIDNKTIVANDKGIMSANVAGMGIPEFKLAPVDIANELTTAEQNHVLSAYQLMYRNIGSTDEWRKVEGSQRIDIYKDQLIKDVQLIDESTDENDPSKRKTILRITWNTADVSADTPGVNHQVTDIELTKFFDIYKVAEASKTYLEVDGYTFELKIDNIVSYVDASLGIADLKQAVENSSNRLEDVSTRFADVSARLDDASTHHAEDVSALEAKNEEQDASIADIRNDMAVFTDSLVWHVL